jgi:hypothetical protein
MSAYVGLDMHSEKTYATIIGEGGKVLKQKKVTNEDLAESLKEYEVKKVGMEASTHIAPIYRALASEGYSVLVSHPKETKYIAKASVKSDRVDSRAIAELVRLDALPLSYVPPCRDSKAQRESKEEGLLG